MPAVSPTTPRLVAIDGFDECSDQAIQHDLLLILASALPRFDYPFQFLIATRPEAHIMQILQHHPSFQCGSVRHLNLNDTNADNDIRTFFVNRFAEIRRTHPIGGYLASPWPAEKDIDKLVRKASSQFIYAATVMNFLSSPEHRPDDRLQVILGLSAPHVNEKPFAQLDILYTYILIYSMQPPQYCESDSWNHGPRN
ncbi:unnamed protein product [Cyclocybe aegerita]|uniref:NACHT domain-containing protein n=1 Tax=Cyclocybe aegerita TaxID=1973307 RepID=A0A8S0VSF0_CYCAE|nr:unnamed protein product [Cyclocybe aegerita]